MILQLCIWVWMVSGALHIKELPMVSFDMEVGTVHESPIQLYFDGFQHARLLRPKDKSYDLNHTAKSICTIQQDKPGQLEHLSNLSYSNSTPSFDSISTRDRIITRFDDLRYPQVLVDSIQQEFLLVSLFTGNKITYHRIDPKTRQVSYLNSYVVLAQTPLTNAKLFNAGGTRVALVTNTSLYDLNAEGPLEIRGFHPRNGSVFDVSYGKQKIYVAWGEEGVSIYEWKQLSPSVQLLHHLWFNFHATALDSTNFNAHEIEVNYHQDVIYILDFGEGVLELPLGAVVGMDKILVTSTAKKLIGSCRSLQITHHYIFLTCPELLRLSRRTGKVESATELSFHPRYTRHHNHRLFIFGYRGMAIYDQFDNMLSQHTLSYHSYESLVVQQFLVSYTQNQVRVERIIPPHEKISCYTAENSVTGLLSGRYEIDGQCEELKQGWEGGEQRECQLGGVLLVNLLDSAERSYVVEIVVLCVVLGVSFIVGLAGSIHHRISLGRYKQLLDQAEVEDRLNTAEREKQGAMVEQGLVEEQQPVQRNTEEKSNEVLKPVKKQSSKMRQDLDDIVE